jgi:two-component system KDP operon response regulator KdpE
MTRPGDVVVLIEDDRAMRRILGTALTAHGFRVIEASTCEEGERAIAEARPEVILLDLGLPDGDGIELLRRIRAMSIAPVIVVSARQEEDDKVLAIEAGADDYMTKPFGMRELVARIRLALRHARGRAVDEPVVSIGPIRIDQARHIVERDGASVHLTPIEFRIVAMLARSVGKVVTHEQLIAAVWGGATAEQTHGLRVHMAAIRRKLEADPARPRWLLTEAGVGYRFRDA